MPVLATGNLQHADEHVSVNGQNCTECRHTMDDDNGLDVLTCSGETQKNLSKTVQRLMATYT